MEDWEEIIRDSVLDPDGNVTWWCTFFTVAFCAGLFLFLGLAMVANLDMAISLLASLAGGLGIGWYLTRLRIVRKFFIVWGSRGGGGSDGGGGE